MKLDELERIHNADRGGLFATMTGRRRNGEVRKFDGRKLDREMKRRGHSSLEFDHCRCRLLAEDYASSATGPEIPAEWNEPGAENDFEAARFDRRVAKLPDPTGAPAPEAQK